MDKGKQKKQINENLFEIQESIIPEDKRIFYPCWNNKPKEAETVILFDKSRFLTTGNLSSLISKPGTGKSSICEAIIAKYINPECDGLGFKVSLKGFRNKILYIDGERTIFDTWKSWERMMERGELSKPKIDKRVIIVNFKAIGVNERIEFATNVLTKNNDLGLIIFDGAADFVIDTNSINEATLFKDWVNTFNPLISTLTTLHTNPTDDKGRGHLGGEIMRRSESILLLRKIDKNTREITANFKYGKIRNDDDNVSHYYSWNDDKGMFLSTEYTPANKKDNSKKHKELLKKILEYTGKDELTNSDILQSLMNMRKESTKAANEKYIQRNLITLRNNGNDNWKFEDYFNEDN